MRARRRFQDVRRYLYPRLEPKERDMLKLADFMANDKYTFMCGPGMATAMGILRDYWPRWFGGKADVYAKYNYEPYWVPWSYFMDDEYIQPIKDDLIANLFNDAGLRSLQDELFKKNLFGNEEVDFDFTTEDPLMWNRVSWQHRTVNLRGFREAITNPRYWTMGDFSLHALPKGRVIPLKGGGHRILITDVYLFIHDTFNFSGFEVLGGWEMKGMKFPALTLPLTIFFNSDFRDFQEKYNYGKNFTVLSPLYRIPDFKGQYWDIQQK